MILKKFKEKGIIIEKFSSSIFGSHYFTSSWVKRTELNNNKLIEKINNLHNKDREKDLHASTINFILCFDTKYRTVILISLDAFLELEEDERVWLFSNWWDFYIPRSVWFKSFCMLNSKDIQILAAELSIQ